MTRVVVRAVWLEKLLTTMQLAHGMSSPYSSSAALPGFFGGLQRG